MFDYDIAYSFYLRTEMLIVFLIAKEFLSRLSFLIYHLKFEIICTITI